MERRRSLVALGALAAGAVPLGAIGDDRAPQGARATTPQTLPTVPDAEAASRTCRAVSGVARATLVEVFTSEGCSSCPPADAWLSGLARREPARVVPLALHVAYWDAIGWKDPYAQAAFAERQRWLTAAGGGRTVYTPGVFLGGREWRRWYDAASVARRLDEGARNAAAARIELAADVVPGADARLVALAQRRDAAAPYARPALFVALTESGLSSRVTAGENRGETLRHDHVVRRLAGPLPFDGSGHARLELPFDAGALRDGRLLAAVAFVQDLDSAATLQAMSMPLAGACARG